MTRLVQLQNGNDRRVAVVEEPRLRLLRTESVYELAQDALRRNVPLTNLVTQAASEQNRLHDLTPPIRKRMIARRGSYPACADE